jgi:hypothetical protein
MLECEAAKMREPACINDFVQEDEPLFDRTGGFVEYRANLLD